jgi:hypothetical protein
VLAAALLGLILPAAAQSSFPPTEAGARALLSQFLPGATVDKGAAMVKLWPTSPDYRSVYNEPLASKLEEAHRRLWEGGVAIGGQPDQTELLVVFARTDDLIDRKPVANEFPGGYGRVIGEMKRGIPIVRFKFVKPGSSLGMAFDGLVYVNGHWVLIPKPWSAAEP